MGALLGMSPKAQLPSKMVWYPIIGITFGFFLGLCTERRNFNFRNYFREQAEKKALKKREEEEKRLRESEAQIERIRKGFSTIVAGQVVNFSKLNLFSFSYFQCSHGIKLRSWCVVNQM